MRPRACLVCCLALVLALAGTAAAAAPPDPRAYPELLAVSDLSAGRTAAGGYPALRDPAALPFPGSAAVAAAARYAEGRAGVVSFAVADPTGGVRGLREDRPYPSASITKAMLLVAELDRLAAAGQRPSITELAYLGYMIRLSDNGSAQMIYRRVGDERLRALARRAGMTGFEIHGDWANATVTAADQARFFLHLDELVAPRFRAFAQGVTAAVIRAQSWGIPQAARPQWHVSFKGGWRPDGRGSLVHQGALLESGGQRVAIAVLSDGAPSESYGHETIRRLAEILLEPAPVPRPAAGPPPRLRPLPALTQLASLSGK